jgi:hypothetical protein
MSEDHVFVSGTEVTRETVETDFGPRDLIYLANEDAPEGYRRIVAGRVLFGSFQPRPFADYAMSPEVLRKIADLIEIKALDL